MLFVCFSLHYCISLFPLRMVVRNKMQEKKTTFYVFLAQSSSWSLLCSRLHKVHIKELKWLRTVEMEQFLGHEQKEDTMQHKILWKAFFKLALAFSTNKCFQLLPQCKTSAGKSPINKTKLMSHTLGLYLHKRNLSSALMLEWFLKDVHLRSQLGYRVDSCCV